MAAEPVHPTPPRKPKDRYERAIMLQEATGESCTERKYSIWRWMELHLKRPSSTQLAFKDYFLPESFELFPKPSDPPPIRSQFEFRELLLDPDMPDKVRRGGLLVEQDFMEDGWGWRRGDETIQKWGHRWRMKLAMRRRRARARKRAPDAPEREDLVGA